MLHSIWRIVETFCWKGRLSLRRKAQTLSTSALACSQRFTEQKMPICLVSKLLTVYDVCYCNGWPSEDTMSYYCVSPPCCLQWGEALVAVYVVDKKTIACDYCYFNSCQYILEKKVLNRVHFLNGWVFPNEVYYEINMSLLI